MRSVGRPRKFATPDDLANAFDEYKAWAELHPWKKQDFIRAGPDAGSIIDLETSRPLTEWEFATFCNMSREGLREYTNREEYSGIYKRIKDEMSAQRISGGLSGAYNHSLVARIDGLVEKQAVEHSGTLSIAEQIANAHKAGVDEPAK